MKCTRLSAFALVAILLSAVPAAAEDRALLVGVGKYREGVDRCAPGLLCNLPGLEKDLAMMQQVARDLGFQSTQVKVLLDEQATLAAIRREFEQWLIQGTSASDRVLFYFSGHGSYIPDTNGDEDDKVDEVLLPHDTSTASSELSNVLTDDALGALLARVRGQALVFVDACHSGTVTKSVRAARGDPTAVVKFYESALTPKAAPAPASSRSAQEPGQFVDTRGAGGRYAALTAAADNEQSLATSVGSLFTRGVLKAVEDAKGRGSLNLLEMRDVAAKEIANLAGARVHHPQMGGSEEMARRNLFARADADPSPPSTRDLWTELQQLVDQAPERLEIAQVKPAYGVKDVMRVSIALPRAGYLNLISVSAVTKTATVLFPNRRATTNAFTDASTVALPAPGSRYEFGFALPSGVAEEQNMLVAIFTEQPLNAYELGAGPDFFRELTADAARDTRGAVVRDKGFAAGKALYLVR